MDQSYIDLGGMKLILELVADLRDRRQIAVCHTRELYLTLPRNVFAQRD